METKLTALKLLGNMLDSEIYSNETPDMDFIRECVLRIEEYFPGLTKSELEAILLEIIEDKRGGNLPQKHERSQNE